MMTRMRASLLVFVILITGAHLFECRVELAASRSPPLASAKAEVSPRRLDEEGDVWSMVASMRQGGGGSGGSTTGRVEADSSTFSKSLKLEWAIDLDAAANYRLSWCANVSRNEILFALDINASKSHFRIGTDLFAVGFSQRGQFESSDFCLLWYDLGHRLHLQDARTSANNTLKLVEASGGAPEVAGACKLLNHHRSSHPDRDSPTLKVEIDYEDDDARLDAERERRLEPAAAALGKRHGRRKQDENLEVIFTRPLEVCDEQLAGNGRGRDYYTIDNGTTHLVWFALRGPLLALDGLNLTEALAASQLADDSIQHADGASAGAPSSSHHFGEHFGMRRVQMIATKSAAAAAPAPASSETTATSQFSKSQRSLDIRMDKFEVPARETTYMCKLFKLPDRFEARRYHITSYEAVIEPGKEHVVHHMELFNCANLTPDERHQLDELTSWAGECGSPERPEVTQKCKRVILAWAMGARPLVYPDEVGQPIGGHHYSPHVLLEVHYNNVASEPNLVDSSGLRFHYSSRLRPFDAGVLEVGLEYTDKNSIPPGMVTPLAGYCVAECTRAAMAHQDHHDVQGRQLEQHHSEQRHHGEASQPASVVAPLRPGIYIFAAQMHTHLTGVASWTEHVRAGQLLGELQRDNHYSPHFQEIRLLPQPVHVAPGDALIHYCLYDTRSRSNITLGGFATSDEMCVTYLHYYPRIDLEVCKSSVDSRALSDHFAYLARQEGQPTTRLADDSTAAAESTPASQSSESRAAHNQAGQVAQDHERRRARPPPPSEYKSISGNYRSIDWSPRRSAELIEFYNWAPLSVQCNKSDGRRWPGHWTGLEPTRFHRLAERQTSRRRHRELADDDVDEADQNDGSPQPPPPPPFERLEVRPFSAEMARRRQKSAAELVAYRGAGAPPSLCKASRRMKPPMAAS